MPRALCPRTLGASSHPCVCGAQHLTVSKLQDACAENMVQLVMKRLESSVRRTRGTTLRELATAELQQATFTYPQLRWGLLEEDEEDEEDEGAGDLDGDDDMACMEYDDQGLDGEDSDADSAGLPCAFDDDVEADTLCPQCNRGA